MALNPGLGCTYIHPYQRSALVLERLPLPDIFTEQEIHELVDAAVRRSLNA